MQVSKFFTNFVTIMYRKELKYYFSTPIAYIVIALYLLVISLMLWVIPGNWNVIDSGYSQLDGLMQLSPWLLLLVCPALTMRLFAEERQSGTWAILRVKPIALWRIVLGKYLAAWTIVVLAQLPCLVHYAAVRAIAEPAGNVDTGAFWGGYIGLIMVSASLTAIGLWASTLSKSQIVSFLLGLVCCFLLFYGFDLLGMMLHGHAATIVEQMGINSHLQSISRGVLDLRDITYFSTLSALFVVLSIQSMKHK